MDTYASHKDDPADIATVATDYIAKINEIDESSGAPVSLPTEV